MRGEHTVDDVARAVTGCGLKWGRGRISDLEAGSVSPTLPTLLILCAAFGDLLGRPIRLHDLLAGNGRVIVAHSDANVVHAPLADVRDALTGEPVCLPKARVSAVTLARRNFLAKLDASGTRPDVDKTRLYRIWRQCGEAEERTARALGVELDRLLELMADRWSRSLSAERDRRAGPNAERTEARTAHTATQGRTARRR